MVVADGANGFSLFKEDVPDLRNSKVWDLIAELRTYGLEVFVHDPVADADAARQKYGIELCAWDDLPQADAIQAAVAHRALLSRLLADCARKVVAGGCFVDVKARFDAAALSAAGVNVWRL